VIVFDLFAGTGSATKAFEDAGDTVITVDNDSRFDVTLRADMFHVTAEILLEQFGQPDFVWASPPCTAFSVASIGHHWQRSGVPKTAEAEEAMRLVEHTRQIVETLSPRYGFVIENPRGMLRKLPIFSNLTRWTVTYCQYGDTRMKPTDLWTNITDWLPRVPCRNGDGCHESAPRGARTGTQGRDGAVLRSMVPYVLGAEIREAILYAGSGDQA